MAQPITDRFRRWFDYEKDAHAKVVRSLDTVPAEKRTSPEYVRALTILGHIAAARLIWLYRLGATAAPPSAIFPKDPTLNDVVASLQSAHKQWDEHWSKLTDADLERVFEYQSLDSGKFRNRIEDVVTQLFGHSIYHRGQIAMLVKQAGGQPAATDFVYWCREALGK